MYDDIGKMDFKQLKNEVMRLRDELALFRRKYEDMIYNLDSDNFAKSFKLEQNGMKTQIKVTSEAVKTMVSEEDLTQELSKYSTIEQTADGINFLSGKVDDANSEISELKISAEEISSKVTAVEEGVKENSSEIKQTASEISGKIATLEEDVEKNSSEIKQTANKISARVSDLEGFKESTFLQTADGFTLDGEKVTFTGVVHITRKNENGEYEKCAALWYDTSQGFPQIRLAASGDVSENNAKVPIVIGNVKESGAYNVFVGSDTTANKVVTTGWIEDNLKVVFG